MYTLQITLNYTENSHRRYVLCYLHFTINTYKHKYGLCYLPYRYLLYLPIYYYFHHRKLYLSTRGVARIFSEGRTIFQIQ